MKKLKEELPDIYEVAKEEVPNFRPVCDECSIEFPMEEILIVRAKNVEFAGILGLRVIKHDKKHYVMASPCCERVHFHGFNDITDET